MPEPKRFRVVLLVESMATNTQIIKEDIHKALAPLGFFPHVAAVQQLDAGERAWPIEHQDISMSEEARLRGQH